MTRFRSRSLRPALLPLLAATALTCASSALAQDANLPKAPNMPDPQATVPEKVEPPLQAGPGETTGTLSDTLSRSEGVIKPPAGVDPEIRKPAPAAGTGRMPVIPPPGEPGGNPQVQPK